MSSDSVIESCPCLEEEPDCSLMPQLTADEPRLTEELICLRPQRTRVREMLMGIAGAFGVHVLMLFLMLTWPHVFSSSPIESSVLVVNLVSLADAGGGVGEGDGLPAGDGSEPTISTEAIPPAVVPFSPDLPSLEETHQEEIFPVPQAPEDKIHEDSIPPETEVTKKASDSLTHKPKEKIPPKKRPQIKTANPGQQKPSRNPSQPNNIIASPPSNSPAQDQAQNAGTAGAGEGTACATGGTGVGTGTKDHSGAGGSPDREFQLAQVDKPPVIITRVEPDYPYMARRQNLSGKVTVKFLVDAHGKVQKPCILKADPKGLFENCVLEALGKWRFKPGYYRGSPVATWVVLPIQFKLSG